MSCVFCMSCAVSVKCDVGMKRSSILSASAVGHCYSVFLVPSHEFVTHQSPLPHPLPYTPNTTGWVAPVRQQC